MMEWITAGLMIVGTIFASIAAIGVFRMPDLFTRMQAATKASTLGVSCIILAVATHFQNLGVTTRALLVIGFLFLTAPVAAHMIARAAYFVGVPLWSRSVVDQLSESQDEQQPPSAKESASPTTVG